MNRFELSEVTLSFVEWCIHFGNGTCHLQVYIPQKSTICQPQTQLACQSPTPGIDIHFCQLCFPAITISYATVHSIKLPIQNSKEIQDIPAKESGVDFLKKKKRRERKKKRSPLSISSANYGVQINSNGKPFISSTPYPPKTPCSMRPGFG